jgi:ABC-type methionine transport system ATPase subunit
MTRVLVTHHVHLLSRCDSVIVLEGGRIKHHGSYFDLVAQGVDFAGAIDVSNIATQEPEVADVRKQDMTPKAPTAVEISDEKKAQLNVKKVACRALLMLTTLRPCAIALLT